MLNAVTSFLKHAENTPSKPALWYEDKVITYSDILAMAIKQQSKLVKSQVGYGDGVLLFAKPSPELFAAVIAILGLGGHAIFIEPWMSLSEINKLIATCKPKAYLTNWLGKLWGYRLDAVWKIASWQHIQADALPIEKKELIVKDLSESTLALLAFTTGTTGPSKCVKRTQGTLFHQQSIFSKIMPQGFGVELCVLPSFALLNLSLGKCSLLINNWRESTLQKVALLPSNLAPTQITSGPGFLKILIQFPFLFSKIEHFFLGGALCDIHLYEQALKLCPQASFSQIYGSSEAEPVAIADVKEVYRKCKEKEYRQSLYLGHFIPEIVAKWRQEELQVSGPHISPYYDDRLENNMVEASSQCLWHSMGDRIVQDDEGLWYKGRIQQPSSQFYLEQQIYRFLGNCNCFVFNDEAGKTLLFGEHLHGLEKSLVHAFSDLSGVIHGNIVRDRRHRARIDRKTSLKKRGL